MNKIFKLASVLYNAILSKDPRKRYENQYRLLGQVVYYLGFQLYNINLFWPSDAAYLNLWRQFDKTSASIKDRKYILYSMAKTISDLPGDTVECGVFDGGGSFLICAATEDRQKVYFHHVFDSFEGLSRPEKDDMPNSSKAFRWQAGDLSVPLDVVKKNLRQFDFIRYYKGWIPDRFDEVAHRKFSFVHIDVDLYQPTRDSIEFFYDRMVPGGIILCDDYGFATCPGAKKAFDEFIADKPEKYVIHLTSGQGFIIKR